jgi:hypothetical protein
VIAAVTEAVATTASAVVNTAVTPAPAPATLPQQADTVAHQDQPAVAPKNETDPGSST